MCTARMCQRYVHMPVKIQRFTYQSTYLVLARAIMLTYHPLGLNIRLTIPLYMYIHIIYTHTHVYVYTCVDAFIYMLTRICIYIHTYIPRSYNVHMHVCTGLARLGPRICMANAHNGYVSYVYECVLTICDSIFNRDHWEHT